MRTNLSCCLGLIDNGQYKSTNRLLVLVPHERPHGIMRILKNRASCMQAVERQGALGIEADCPPASNAAVSLPYHDPSPWSMAKLYSLYIVAVAVAIVPQGLQLPASCRLQPGPCHVPSPAENVSQSNTFPPDASHPDISLKTQAILIS